MRLPASSSPYTRGGSERAAPTHVFGRIGILHEMQPVIADDLRRHARYGHALRHIFHDHRSRADTRVEHRKIRMGSESFALASRPRYRSRPLLTKDPD